MENSNLVETYIENESKLEKILIGCSKKAKKLIPLLKELKALKGKCDKMKGEKTEEEAANKRNVHYNEKDDSKRANCVMKARGIIDNKMNKLTNEQHKSFEEIKKLISKLNDITNLNAKNALGLERNKKN